MTFASPTGRGALLVVAATAGFATLGTLATLAYQAGMSSPVFVTLRALVGALVLAGVLLAQPGLRVPVGTLPARQRSLLAAAVAVNGAFNLALFAAFGLMSVAVVLAIYFTYPLLVAAASVAMGRERFTLARSSGLLLGIAGVLLILGPQLGSADAPLLGIAMAIVAAGCQATYLVTSRSGFPSVPAEQAITLVLAGGASMAALLVLAVEGVGGFVGPWTAQPVAWLAVLAAGLLGTAAAKVWVLRGLRLLGGTRTAVIMLGEPVVGALLAALVLAQPITLQLAVGGLLILAAALLVQRPAPGRGPGRSSPSR